MQPRQPLRPQRQIQKQTPALRLKHRAALHPVCQLAGSQPLQRAAAFEGAELPSEGTALGALQVPANGQPVLFLADHPLTGGYPVVGCVAAHHLDLAAQLPAGTLIRFRAQRPFQEICLS